MNANHIQIPKKVDITAVRSALAAIDFGALPAPELEILEFTNLYVVDGIFSADHRSVLSAAFEKHNIPHF